MTLAVALILIGALMVYAGLKGYRLSQLLQGRFEEETK